MKTKIPKSMTFGEMLADPAINRAMKRINKRHLYMSEQNLVDIVNDVLKAFRIIEERS